MTNSIHNLAKINRFKKLNKGKRKKSGRNHRGVITVRHQGGGHKQNYRQIDFQRENEAGVVVNYEYDPNRSSHIVKLWNLKSNNFFYILKPKNIEFFQKVKVWNERPLQKVNGDHCFLKDLDVGDFIHNLQSKPNSINSLIRSAGTFGQIIQKTTINGQNHSLVKLPSGEKKLFSDRCTATLGLVGNEIHRDKIIGKAGKSRWLNKRPTVRGVAMNPIDHPHGGGEGKTSGGRPSVTPWGKPTKGQKTRSKKNKNFLILERRK